MSFLNNEKDSNYAQACHGSCSNFNGPKRAGFKALASSYLPTRNLQWSSAEVAGLEHIATLATL